MNITGQFLPLNSPMHRLDAAVKMAAFMLLTAAVICCSSPVGYILLAACTGLLIWLSSLPIRVCFASLRRCWSFLLVIFLMNALFFEQGRLFWQWGIIHISSGGLIQGAQVALRVGLIIVLGNILTCVTAPTAITAALASLMSPLKLLRLPVEEIAMILGVAFQFIPVLSLEAQNILMAQTARGAGLEGKKLREKAADALPLIVPIFVAAFRRADELATAMEARGYRGARGRTPGEKRRITGRDWLALLLCSALLAAEIWL